MGFFSSLALEKRLLTFLFYFVGFRLLWTSGRKASEFFSPLALKNLWTPGRKVSGFFSSLALKKHLLLIFGFLLDATSWTTSF